MVSKGPVPRIVYVAEDSIRGTHLIFTEQKLRLDDSSGIPDIFPALQPLRPKTFGREFHAGFSEPSGAPRIRTSRR